MTFSNEEKAKQCLAHISYFRLKYYWSDMRDEETEHDFKEGASFDNVIARYDFDRNLRLILFDAIEIIEVALRAKIINHLSNPYKVTKSREQYKINDIYFYCRDGVTSRCKRKVTKSREKNKTNWFVFYSDYLEMMMP